MSAVQTRPAAAVPAPPSTAPVQSGLLQRKCACGNGAGLTGECAECRKKRRVGLQPKLQVGAPGDRYEQEADRIADQVLRTDDASVNSRGPAHLQRLSASHAASTGAPPIVGDVLQSPGRPLDASTRAYFEPRLGHDFGNVRVHTDAPAAESAKAVDAMAYTVGSRLVFAANHYAPRSDAGRRLLAHELVHVVQQSGGTSHAPAPSSSRPWVQRKLVVDRPGDPIASVGGRAAPTKARTVEGYLHTLCPNGGATVNTASGAVDVPNEFCCDWVDPVFGSCVWIPFKSSPAETPGMSTSCTCLCDMARWGNEWVIRVDDSISWPATAAKVASQRDPGNYGEPRVTLQGGVISVPSPNHPYTWGAETAMGKLEDVEPWLVLGHELCGHAWLLEKGRQSLAQGSRQREDEETFRRENALRGEHGIDPRGAYGETPRCGESYRYRKAGGRKRASREWNPNEECPGI